MPSIEIGPKGLQTARAVGAVDAKTAPQAAMSSNAAAVTAHPQPAVVRSNQLDPGQPPVDSERVQQIRKAIENGTYPMVPTRVSDAMIAAGLLLRSGK